MKNITINVLDLEMYSFRVILDKEFDIHSSYETYQLEYVKESNGVEFNFQFQNFDADQCFVNEIGDNTLYSGGGFTNNESNKSSGCNIFNFVLFVNTSVIYNKDYLKQIKKELNQLYQLKNEIKLNIVLVIISNQEFIISSENETDKEFEKIKEFQNQLNIPIENIINFGDYSNKEFQNTFILESIYYNFGKFNKEQLPILKNDNEVLELVYYQVISTTVNVGIIELYEQLVNVEYSKLAHKLSEVVNTFKKKLYVLSSLGVVLTEEDVKLYNNLRVLYLISKIDLNYPVYRFLYGLFEGDAIIEINKIAPLQIYNYSLEHVMISSEITVSSRIAQVGNLSMFQKYFNNDLEWLIKCDRHPHKSCSITWIVDYKYWDILKWLLEVKNNEMEIQDQISWQSIALTRSSYNGDLEMFKYIITHCNCKVNIDTVHMENEYQMNSFHYASLMGRLNIVKYICEQLNYTNINGKSGDVRGMTAIHFAAEKHEREIIDYLIDVKHVDINQTDDYGEIPLFRAAKTFKYHHKNQKYTLSFCNYLINERNSNITCFSKEYGREINIQNEYLSQSFCVIL